MHNFWDIRQYLPAETRAYVPSFIAIVYSMKYASKYGISPAIIDRESTQRVTVREKITVGDLENIIGIPRQVIIDENPSLLTTLIPADFTLNIPVSRFTAFNQYQDSLYVKAENVTVAQKLVVPKVVRPVSSPKESPVTENCDEPVALVVKNKDEFSTEPIIKGKENKSTSKSKTDNKDVVDDESFFTKLKNKILPSKPKEAEKPVAVKETPKPKETKQVPVKTELKNDKKKDAYKDIPVAEVKVKKSAKNEEKPTATIVKAPEKPTIKPLNTNTSTSKKINTPELIKEDDDNYCELVSCKSKRNKTME